MSTEGLITGLQSAIDSFYRATKAREDREAAKKEKELEYRARGFLPQYDEQGGVTGLVRDPEQIKAEQAKSREDIRNKAILEGREPQFDEGGGLIAAPYSKNQMEYLSAKREADPTTQLLKGLQTQKIVGDIEEQKQKRAESVQKKQLQASQAKEQAQLVNQELGRALQMIESSPMASGSIAGQSMFMPGTPAYTLDKMLETVKANIGFDKLSVMRQSSPTGAGLGSISDREVALLQATAGKLDPRLPTPVLLDNVKRLINQRNDIIHGPGNGPKRYELSFDESGNPIKKGLVNAGPQPGTIENGYRFKGGDPADQNNWEQVK